MLSFSTKQRNVQERWIAPKWTDSIMSPYLIEPLTLPLGEELYEVYCKSCHTKESGYKTLTDWSAQNILAQSNGALFWKISEGRGNMPSFKQVLTEEQRWQLIHYIRDKAKPYHLQENPFKIENRANGQILVKKTSDFKVDGEGRSENWKNAEWIDITLQESVNDVPIPLKTRAKTLYSETGIYFLFWSEDEKLSATIQEDFGPLFREDVVEIFLWPDPTIPIYFEYELSPLNYELAFLVPNINGKFQGWRPTGYEGRKRTQHATSVQGGEKKSNAQIKSWTAEVFIPYILLNPIVQSAPKPGTSWRANLYRIDYDKGYTSWTWQKTTPKLRGSLHEFNKFGTLIFE